MPARFDQIEWTVDEGADFLAESGPAIELAAEQARDADLVIVAVGEPSSLSGEASSRSLTSASG